MLQIWAGHGLYGTPGYNYISQDLGHRTESQVWAEKSRPKQD